MSCPIKVSCRRESYSRLVVLAVLAALLPLASAAEPKRKEQDKIDALLKRVETAEGLKFIRNGATHDAKAAAAHMKRKLNTAGEKVQTVEEFIDQCGTKSGNSGEPYQIKTADGKPVPAADWLRAELKKIQ